MTTHAEIDLLDSHEALSNLHISSPVPVVESEPNPWQDPSTEESSRDDVLAATPSVKAGGDVPMDPSVAQGFAAAEDAEAASEPISDKPQPRPDILQEFDPLASHEEQAAKAAWESSESHPAPPAPEAQPQESTDDPPPPPPAKDTDPPARPTSPLSAFPSLAALARTFALPLGNRQRPRSLDTATAVPSPATLSSFASQQQMPPLVVPSSSSAPGSGRSTPSSGARSRQGADADTDPPQFDFQKFLDQMKLKAAEPVAKYLRSYVCALMVSIACNERFPGS